MPSVGYVRWPGWRAESLGVNPRTKPASDVDTAVGNWSGTLWRRAEGQGRTELAETPHPRAKGAGRLSS